MKWYFENILARNETAVDDGTPLIEQRWKVYQKMMKLQPCLLILMFAVGVPAFSRSGREGLVYFYVVSIFALTVEYVYFRFFHGKSKKTVDN